MPCYRVFWSLNEEIMANTEEEAIKEAESFLMDSLTHIMIKSGEPGFGEPSWVEEIECHPSCLYYKEEDRDDA